MTTDARLLYDGDCPICDRYRDYVALREKVELELFDARSNEQLVAQFRHQGYDIEEGMIFELDDSAYQGDEAVVAMRMLVDTDGIVDRLVDTVLGYPIAKQIRLLLLKLLGRDTTIRSEQNQQIE